MYPTRLGLAERLRYWADFQVLALFRDLDLSARDLKEIKPKINTVANARVFT